MNLVDSVSKSSTVSSGQLPQEPRVLRQSYTLMMLNIVYMELEQSAYSNFMPDRETRAHSSTSSTASSGLLPPWRLTSIGRVTS